MPLTTKALLAQVSAGEDSSRQFKSTLRNAEALAAEMAAFANSEGGVIYIGVADDGSMPGLSGAEVGRVNQLISNAASQLARSPLTVQTENIRLGNGRVVIALKVPKGLDKPYFDKNGVIWLKSGADKRRIHSKEELRRLFQMTSQFHADELPTKAGLDKLDKLRFRDFLQEAYKIDYPESPEELARLLQNMNLATEDGRLNLAAALMFAEHPAWIVPQFTVKAIRYPGNAIHPNEYQDTEDFEGPLRAVFEGSQAFILRNLHKVQAGRGVNAPGLPEIPAAVFEELLVKALVHRDYLISAPIRIFVFDDRIEIISPGHLPNNLTVEKIKAGNSNIRNPILVSFVAKGLLPYHGLGSGIKRALDAWPDIAFASDRENEIFKATVYRKAPPSEPSMTTPPQDWSSMSSMSSKTSNLSSNDPPLSSKGLPLSSNKPSVSSNLSSNDPPLSPKEPPLSSKTRDQGAELIDLIRQNQGLNSKGLAAALGVSQRTALRRLQALKGQGRIRRVGSNRSGYWELVE